MNTILCLGIVLVGALVAEKIISYLKIPAITSYILLGILLGPFALNVTGEGLIASSELFSNIVLGFIAFHIGKNFSIENFKRIGKVVLFVSIAVTVATLICVTLGIYYVAHQPFHISLLFGAISTATAPATTMMVIRQYRARGLFTDVLLGTVAIDDAWGIIIFSVSLAIAQVLQIGQFSEWIIMAVTVKAAGKIFLSVILGSIIAIIASKISIYLKRREDVLTFILGAILINTGVALYFHLSPLLSNMFFGTVLVNIGKTPFRFFDTVNSVDWPLYVMFYVLAGANLNIGLLSSLGLIGSVYIISRIVGRIAGAYTGAIIAGTEQSIRKYMGLALMAQAGVAIGLAIMARTNLPKTGGTILNTIIATTVIYEILGPIATRYSLSKAGDI
ncbi:sodium/hydrogen exchanger [Candidatus Scalindua japonica]|uniref:Sodium/hydrogen exchanger n=1 Tax=Candidatus Scalindua japonica TaxID=1284222 RepID=A0A286TXT2_9BACT|nr:cation:proton antiporter [Candidatus Scalindua japonica]GAX60709.1 sodium/hydrogen exchanger [Candidatus Scalindua japonica]